MSLHHDINVPLAAASSSSKRKRQAHSYQMRLHQLGYRGVAFCHTAYGRLKEDKDDADVALPWLDIDGGGGKNDAFGRTNSLGMRVYRRLNIVVEEVSDVSRILLPADARDDAAAKLLRKYDIVSLQPMNEPALQNICQLLSSSDAATASSPKSSVNFVDIIVLEYATGSRGGHGLPFKVRKEYLVKALQAGVTFEVCYGAAVLDAKRRQGFLRTLVDFRFNYTSIQKKHALLNKQCKRRNGQRRSEKFPLLVSSGARQNYTLGSGDMGALAFRTPRDVKCLIGHLVGGEGWFDKGGEGQMHCDDGDGAGKNRHKRKVRTLMSAAEKVLARASERALGVSVAAPPSSMQQQSHKRQKRAWESRSSLVDGFGDDSDGEEQENGPPTEKVSASLVQWLSESLPTETKDETETSDEIARGRVSNDEINHSAEKSEPRAESVPAIQHTGKSEDSEKGEDLEDGFIAL
ncbi:hypothetical protein ACHAXT_012286 [Thalassiosira profunda]